MLSSHLLDVRFSYEGILALRKWILVSEDFRVTSFLFWRHFKLTIHFFLSFQFLFSLLLPSFNLGPSAWFVTYNWERLSWLMRGFTAFFDDKWWSPLPLFLVRIFRRKVTWAIWTITTRWVCLLFQNLINDVFLVKKAR